MIIVDGLAAEDYIQHATRKETCFTNGNVALYKRNVAFLSYQLLSYTKKCVTRM